MPLQLVKSTYPGTIVAGNNDIGNNVPESTFKRVGFSLASNFSHFGTKPKVEVQLAKERNATNQWDDYSFIASKDAYNLDLKYDDGHPRNGIIITARGNDYYFTAGRCVNQSENISTTNVSYIPTDTQISCRMYFILE